MNLILLLPQANIRNIMGKFYVHGVLKEVCICVIYHNVATITNLCVCVCVCECGERECVGMSVGRGSVCVCVSVSVERGSVWV